MANHEQSSLREKDKLVAPKPQIRQSAKSPINQTREIDMRPAERNTEKISLAMNKAASLAVEHKSPKQTALIQKQKTIPQNASSL